MRARDVSVSLRDEKGRLGVSVAVPVVRAELHGATLMEAGERVRCAVIEGMRSLGGREAGVVDVRYAGVAADKGKRVA